MCVCVCVCVCVYVRVCLCACVFLCLETLGVRDIWSKYLRWLNENDIFPVCAHNIYVYVCVFMNVQEHGFIYTYVSVCVRT